MPKFIRVRQVGGPAHEFDAAADEVRARPHLYDVVDETPVSKPRPVKYVVPAPEEPEVDPSPAEPEAEPKKSGGRPKKEQAIG